MDEFFSLNVQASSGNNEIDLNFIYDAVIIGGGPAGLTAAIYSGRSGLNTLVLEKLAIGGKIAVSRFVENYPGFPDGISGEELIKNFEKQALRLGAKIVTTDARSIEKRKNLFYISTLYGEIKSKVVIVSTGTDPIKLPLKEESKFSGRGISYCATCDGSFFKGRTVAVIGGGDTALYDAIYLTKFAEKVILVHRRKTLRATKRLKEMADSNSKITYELEEIPVKINGDKNIEALVLKNVVSHKIKEIAISGIFSAIGTTPNSKMFENLVKLDEHGYITTNNKMETSLPGLFAIGDVRSGLLKQVITACSDGAIAASEAEQYIINLER